MPVVYHSLVPVVVASFLHVFDVVQRVRASLEGCAFYYNCFLGLLRLLLWPSERKMSDYDTEAVHTTVATVSWCIGWDMNGHSAEMGQGSAMTVCQGRRNKMVEEQGIEFS